MKLLVSVIAAAAADGHGSAGHGEMGGGMGSHDNMGPAATTTAMPSHGNYETTTQFEKPNYTTDFDKEDHFEDMKDKECPTAGGCRGAPCNEAMAKWRQEMSQWKYMQNEWVKEFKYWKQENDRMEWNDGWQAEWEDMKKPNQQKDYENDYEDAMESDWFNDMWQMVAPFLDDPDILCPMLGMIGEGWEDGCRQQMATQAAFMQLFENMAYMNSQQFSNSFCQMVGGIMIDQFRSFGMPEVALAIEYAEGSCNCLVANIHDMSSNGFNFAQVANVGTCANTITNYVNMLMAGMGGHGDMDQHDMLEMAEWFSEENVNNAIVTVNALNLDLSNENLINLLKWWDTEGTFASWGIFDPEFRTDQNVAKAIAYSWIYVMNTNPEFNQDNLISVFTNAGDWNDFYEAIFSVAVKMFEKQYPNKDANEVALESWQKIMGMMENFWQFFNENFVGIDNDSFYNNLAAMSWSENATADNVQAVFEDFFNNQQDVTKLTQLVNSYDQWFMNDNPMPQKMHFMFGLAKCLNADQIAEWNAFTNEDPVEAMLQVSQQWSAGVQSLYVNDADFFVCMQPFNEFVFNYDAPKVEAEVDMSAWFSEEAVGQSIAVISGLNLDINDDLLDVLEWWDTDGKFAEMGIFNSETRTVENVIKAVAFAWIYVKNTSDLDQEAFVSVLQNADQWNAFYQSAYNVANNMFANRFPDADSDALVLENWREIMSMMENFWQFYTNNILESDDFDPSEFYAKLSAMSWKEEATADAIEEAFTNFVDNMAGASPAAVTNLMNKYNDWFIADNDQPQAMQYMLGFANCLSLDQVLEYNNVDMSNILEVPALVMAKWSAGINDLYQNNEDFQNCMSPFDKFGYDYTNPENNNNTV